MRYLYLKVLLLGLIIYKLPAQPVPIIRDTIQLNFFREFRPALVHQDTVYAFFDEGHNIYNAHTEEFFVFGPDGSLIKQVPVPIEVNGYYDLFVRKDTVFVHDYYDQEVFYLNKDLQFEKHKAIKNLVYEDSAYQVFSYDRGEWGGITWIKNRSNGEQYVVDLIYPLVNLWQGAYYFSSGYELYRINNPAALRSIDPKYHYHKDFDKNFDYELFFELMGQRHSEHGIEKLYLADAPSAFYFDERPEVLSIQSTAILNQELYHLCEDSTGIFLAQWKDGKMNPVYYFERGMWFFHWAHDYRHRIDQNRYQSLQFKTKDPDVFGILDFQGDQIKMRYFKNNFIHDTLGVVGSRGFLKKALQVADSNGLPFKLELGQKLEEEFKAYEIETLRKKRLLDPSLTEKSPKIYRKPINKEMALWTHYYYKQDSGVYKVRYSWESHSLFPSKDGFYSFFQDQAKYRSSYLKAEQKLLLSLLKAKYQEPASAEIDENKEVYQWEQAHFSINLYYRFGAYPSDYSSLSLTIEEFD